MEWRRKICEILIYFYYLIPILFLLIFVIYTGVKSEENWF